MTFTYAGLQKLANRFFFNASNPGSIQAQLHASIATSPIGGLLRPAAHVAVALGLLIAIGELAVGLGTLFGLFGRVAAAGGMVLSFILFLSVSFNTTPYFYGSDIVFLFAWTPLVIGGLGAWSLDGVLSRRDSRGTGRRQSASRTSRRPPSIAAPPFEGWDSRLLSAALRLSPPGSRPRSAGCSVATPGPRTSGQTLPPPTTAPGSTTSQPGSANCCQGDGNRIHECSARRRSEAIH